MPCFLRNTTPPRRSASWHTAHLTWNPASQPGRWNPPLPRTARGQLCAASWVSQSRPDATQPWIEPGAVVMALALQCSTLDRCASREAQQWTSWPSSLEFSVKRQSCLRCWQIIKEDNVWLIAGKNTKATVITKLHTVEVGSLHTLRLDSLKLVFQYTPQISC